MSWWMGGKSKSKSNDHPVYIYIQFGSVDSYLVYTNNQRNHVTCSICSTKPEVDNCYKLLLTMVTKPDDMRSASSMEPRDGLLQSVTTDGNKA